MVFGTDRVPSPEQIRDRYAEITDMSQAGAFANATEIARKVYRLVVARK